MSGSIRFYQKEDKMKKIFALLLSIALLFALFVGCMDRDLDNTDEDTSDYAEGVTISPNGKEVYVDTKEGKTRLKISYTEAGYGGNWLRVIASHFVKENPDVWVYLDGDPGLTELVSTQLESGINLPDMYMPLASNWQSYALTDWLEELSDVYSAKPDGENGKTVYEKMSPAWQEYCIASNRGVEGKYAYPWSMAVSGIVYNGTMFEKYGWDIPETLDELVELCQKIKTDTNGTVMPFVYPGTVGGYFDFMGMTFWMQSSGIDGLKEFFEFDSAEVFNPEVHPGKGKQEALEAFTRLFGPDASYSLKGSMSKNHIEAQMSFLRGEAAMIINASWMEVEMKEDLPEGFEMRMMRFPYISTAKRDGNGDFIKVNYATTPDYIIIPKAAPNKEIAKKFLVFMAKDEMLKYFTKHTGSLRPFEYDVTGLRENLSAFVNDCIDIWETSESYFDMPKGILAFKGYVRKYLTAVPYSLLIYGPDNDGTTASRFCRQEYQEAKGNWSKWLDEANAT